MTDEEAKRMAEGQLVEKVARAIETADTSEVPDNFYKGDADDISDWGAYLAAAVIAVLRPVLQADALEEAAKVAEAHMNPFDIRFGGDGVEIAAAIRALKEDSSER